MEVKRQIDGLYVAREHGMTFLVADKPRKLGMTDPTRKGWSFARIGGQSFGWGHSTKAQALEAVARIIARDCQAV